MIRKISMWQFVLLCYLCRMFTAMTYTPAMGVGSSGTSVLISRILLLGVNFAAMLPGLWLYRQYQEKNVVELSLWIDRKLGVGVAFLYGAFTLFTAVSTLANFNFFMTNAVFPQAPTLFFLLTIWAAAIYAARMGIESIARTSSILFGAFLISFLFILFASLNQVDLINLKLPLEGFVGEVGSSIYEAFSRTGEFVAILFLLPHLNGKGKRGVFLFLLMLTVSLEIIGFLVLTVLGDFAAVQTIPYYTLSSIAEFSIFQRLDALHMTIWVAMGLLKIVLYLFLTVECVSAAFPLRHRKKVAIACGALLLLFSIPFCYSQAAFQGLYQFFATGIPSILLVVVVPLLIGVGMKIKKGGIRRETEASAMDSAAPTDLRN